MLTRSRSGVSLVRGKIKVLIEFIPPFLKEVAGTPDGGFEIPRPGACRVDRLWSTPVDGP
jgi:hypothetical protein